VKNGECSKCHNPHQAKLAKLMRAQGVDLCVTCHAPIGKALKDERAHSPAARDCQKCHLPHSAPERALLVKNDRDLCSDCHDVTAAGFSKAHLGIDPKAMSCVKCHQPHASKDPNLFRAQVHAPFVGGSCEECHDVVKP
jgi:predicted CXXCH cytochrome family protein